jgi:hypothetical protein
MNPDKNPVYPARLHYENFPSEEKYSIVYETEEMVAGTSALMSLEGSGGRFTYVGWTPA